MQYPGPTITRRKLHFIWIADCSGSMVGEKIQTLNTAIRETIPDMRSIAQQNPFAEVLVRAIKFSDGATWHVAQETPVEQFTWPPLTAGGQTAMGKALLMVADQLKLPPGTRGLPPVLVLLTDGYATDDATRGIQAILNEPWGKKAIRIGIAIGRDADHSVLEKFIANPEIPVLQANNAETLVQYIRWASTVPLQSASTPNVAAANASPGVSQTATIYVPKPPSNPGGQNPGSVW